MSKWIVVATVRLAVEFEDDETPTAKSAEYVASSIGLNIWKEGSSKKVGRFKVSSETTTIQSVERVGNSKKPPDNGGEGLARRKK